MTAYLTAPGLLVHVFWADSQSGSQESRDRLRSRGPDAPAWRASAWASRGILGVTVAMTSPEGTDCVRAWPGLERAWEETAARLGLGDVLGEARIFCASLGCPSGQVLPGGDAAGHVQVLVRGAAPGPSEGDWWRRRDAVPLGPAGQVLVWEIGSWPGAPAVRRLAAVAAPRSQGTADLPWPVTGDGVLAPVGRHLMHAALVRHRIRAFGEGRAPGRLGEELGLLAGALSGDLAGAFGEAIASRAELDAMRHDVHAAAEGMSEALSLPPSAAGAGPLSRDRELAARFGRRMDDEIAGLEAAIRNAQLVRRYLAGAGGRDGAAGAAGPPPASSRPPRRPPPRDRTGPPPQAGARPPWAVVFTALPVEYQAVREYLAGPVRQHEERGTLYEVGALPGEHDGWQIVLAQTGSGSTAAGVQLDRAIRVFDPEVALFIGVAGGRKEVARGDVVVAEMIYNYEWGKSTLEGFQPRIRTHHPSHRLLQRARLVAREDRWQYRILPRHPDRPPASFVKPVVAGDKVITHHRSAVALLIDQYAGDALAVETEGHGFLEAAYLNPGADVLVIRGISDLLAGKTEASDDYWQPVASRHAAAFAVELLTSIGSSRTR